MAYNNYSSNSGGSSGSSPWIWLFIIGACLFGFFYAQTGKDSVRNPNDTTVSEVKENVSKEAEDISNKINSNKTTDTSDKEEDTSESKKNVSNKGNDSKSKSEKAVDKELDDWLNDK